MYPKLKQRNEDDTLTRFSWKPSYVHDANTIVQFCSSNGKYLTSTAHELRNITIDNHVTLPSDVTMTFVLIDDLYADTSAL